MKNLFQQLILDFHKAEIPTPTHRDIDLPELPPNVRKAIVFIGMRRSGKTWFMYQRMQELLNQGVSPQQILYINFEDNRLEDASGKDLEGLLEAYFELYPEYTNSDELYFFFDEIHEVPNWEKFVRRLLDSEKMQLYVTGSSAKLLSKEIATNLRGRTITREIYPYSFREYLVHQKIAIPKKFSSKDKAIFSGYVKEFIRWGGFPETVGMNPALHREILQSYVQMVIYRDIVDRYKVTNTAALERLLTFCLKNCSSLLSVNKVYHTLKSLGYTVSKNTLYDFMHYFEDAYCIFSQEVFHPSGKRSSQKPKKIYPVDQGLATAHMWNDEFMHGMRLEAAVFSFLKRNYHDCHYYQTDNGLEVDFIVEGRKLYQVTLSMEDEKTREREFRALRKAMEELKVKKGTIITLDEEGEENGVSLVPAWRFLLGQEF